MALPPFQALLDRHGTEVHRFLVAMVGPSDADDCFQETFLSALRAYPRLAPGSNLRAWVMTIAHRKAIDFHRGRARRPVPVGELPEAGATDGRPAADAALWAAVRALPPKQRAAVAHRFVCDRSYGDIGELIGCSEEAARRNVHEGLKRLREVVA